MDRKLRILFQQVPFVSSVLPNSLKTEIVISANLREWKHIFTLRTSKAAHPQMREIMIPLRKRCRELIPVIFDEERASTSGATLNPPNIVPKIIVASIASISVHVTSPLTMSFRNAALM